MEETNSEQVAMLNQTYLTLLHPYPIAKLTVDKFLIKQ